MGVSRVVVLLVLVAVMASSVGCARPRYRVKEKPQITGPALVDGSRPVVDVSNFGGSVKVLVRPKFKKAKVIAKMRRTGSDSPRRKQLDDLITVTAESVVENGKPVLRVRSEAGLEDPGDARADLIICLPDCSGANIRNAEGTVDLRHIDGPITVENGTANRPGGRVEVRTEAAMTYPVHVTTSSGIILYQVPVDSTGRFELTSDTKQAAFYALGGDVAAEKVTHTQWIGTLNDGTNPVVLHSRGGAVWVRIIENAGTYKPPRWPRGKHMSIQPPR